MPMTWDAAADAKLFACVMQVYDVKITGSKLEDVAALMGDDCTAKAITHRLAKLRNLAGITTPSNRGRKAATPGTTPSRSGKGKGKGTQPTLMTDKNDDDDDEETVTPLKRKAMKIKSEDGFGHDEKKVKAEPVDGAEGLEGAQV